MSRSADLERFYEIMDELRARGVERRLRDCGGRMDWPERGVYFFFEDGERRVNGSHAQRVVRVGTHALTTTSSTTLWNRLSQHRGVVRSGGGNHRGSIFRLLVGKALLRRDGRDVKSWGLKESLSAAASNLGVDRASLQREEAPVEQAVSDTIRAMPFTWVRVDEPGPGSDRGFIERGSIALLSGLAKDKSNAASPEWLGRHSDRVLVRDSGLWNNDHVDEEYDPAFLKKLKMAAERTALGCLKGT